MTPEGTRFTAIIGASDDEGGIELVVNKSIPAGIDGPCNTARLDLASLYDVERYLADRQFTRTSDWRLRKAYDGLRLEADLEYTG